MPTDTANRKGPPIQVIGARCTGCLICELRCSLRFEKAFNPSAAAIAIRRTARPAAEYSIAFTERCDNCGICARYCVYGALVQQHKGGSQA